MMYISRLSSALTRNKRIASSLSYQSASLSPLFNNLNLNHNLNLNLNHPSFTIHEHTKQWRCFSSSSSPLNYNNENGTSGSSSGVYDKIAFIGAGKMAQALISPLVHTSIQPEENISIYDVSLSTMDEIHNDYPKIQLSQSIPDAIEGSDLIILAVKPQNVCKVYSEMVKGDTIRSNATLLSIIAGKPISSFINGTGIQKVARSMPNTPAQIGQGVTVWTCTSNIHLEERERIDQVLCSFGKSIFVDDESYIDMSTSLSGSGPAYIFLLMEAMIDAGVHMGFSRETATALVHQTLLGSTLYAMDSKQHPAILRNSVTSPAGTTASAIYELENGKFRTVIKDAIWACYRRSLEMGGSDSNVGPGRVNFPQVNLKEMLPDSKIPGSHHPIEPPSDEMTNVSGEKK
mmetsp:Transcript_8457/g.12692  ORF Transcript_8457/g.12692 Transcript_8457/m.12692 type:complete len:403 (+) Transcript_8457:102-1310(+)